MDKELQKELEQKLCDLCCDNCEMRTLQVNPISNSEVINCIEKSDRTKCSKVNRFKAKAMRIILWLISKI